MENAAFRSYALSLTVPQKEIYYISWNIDATEGLGLLKTEDAAAGRVTVFTTGSMVSDLLAMIEGLKQEGLAISLDNVSEMGKTYHNE